MSVASASMATSAASSGATVKVLKMAQDAQAQSALQLIAATVESTAQMAQSETLGQAIDVYA